MHVTDMIMHQNMYICKYIHSNADAYICIFIYLSKYTYMNMNICIYICIHIYMCNINLHTYAYD
jgi:hypothetical protein